MILLTSAITFTAIVFFVIRFFIKCYRYAKHLERFPSPPRLPLIGNALEFQSSSDIIPKFTRYKELYGPIIKLYFGPLPTRLLISDYKFVEYILTSKKILGKSHEYSYLSRWLGNGLITAAGDRRWRKHRKIIGPAFHGQIFGNFLEVFESNTKLLVKKLSNELGKSSFDIHPFIKLCSLDIICEAAMGRSIHAQENSESEYVQNVHSMCKIFVGRAYNPILRNSFLYKVSKLYRSERSALKILHSYTTEMIQKQKQFLHKTIQETVETEHKTKMTFLDLLLRENDVKQTLTDSEMRDEVSSFMFAGHDTVASALSFAIFCLAENPAAQNKAIEELKQIFQDNKTRSVTLTDVHQMKYLEAVIKETLRIYPPVPYIQRNVPENFEYDGGIIPKGIALAIDIYGLHHSSDKFFEPKKFLPERFMDKNASNKLSYVYMPFSAGPRNCIGQKFAMLEMKFLLSMLLREYEILTSIPRHKPLLSTEIVLFSKNGIHVRIKKRTF